MLASDPLIGFVRGLGISDDVLRWWPVLLVGLSLFFLVPSLVGRQHRRLRAGMVLPGAMLAGILVHSLLYAALFEDPFTWVIAGAAVALAGTRPVAVEAPQPVRPEPVPVT